MRKRHARGGLKYLFGGTAGILFFLFAPQVYSAEVTLAWDPNIETDLRGYKVYCGSLSKEYQYCIDVGNATTCTVGNLSEGETYYFAATAYDGSGNESAQSEEVSHTVPLTTPVNSAPVVYDGRFSTMEGMSVSGTLNAADPDGDVLFYTILTTPSMGSAIIVDSSRGTFTYTPSPGLSGTDSFTFKVSDGQADSNAATVVVEIAARLDTDGDGLKDAEEARYGTDAAKADTDGDGINDGDEVSFWASDWCEDYDGDGVINLLDPDSDNDGISDGEEIARGTNPELPEPSDVAPVEPVHALSLEIGELTVDSAWRSVAFGAPFVDPIVVAKPVSCADNQPGVVRVRNISQHGFEIRVQEWDYLDDRHGSEIVGYLVVERGCFSLQDGALVEAGRVETNSVNSFVTIPFQQTFRTTPVVIAAVSTVNESDAVTTRLRNVTTQGFDCTLQEQEANTPAHATEVVSFVAWEPCKGMLNGLVYEVRSTGDVVKDRAKTVSFQSGFSRAPIFLADMQSTDGFDTATLRWLKKDRKSITLQIDEEQSRDRDTRHPTETVGYMAFDSLQ